ncbi:LPS translocon maturation chaperone LptM [Burkholderia sp. LMU1-1-1.1]|uniref:LPS translocon maturation chaperone LptM n=1 Tax=Burkholderia sp. LMU1-1-1.1 TaxID=3135266 RepID=UPI0034150E70
MKSSFRLFIGTITLALTVLLSGCGQTGPLYLPKPTAKPAKSGDAKVTPAGTPAAVTPAAPADPTPGAPATPVPVTPSPVPSTLPAPQQ